jgi:hypothetical protein
MLRKPDQRQQHKAKECPRELQASLLYFLCYLKKIGRISVTGSKAKRYFFIVFLIQKLISKYKYNNLEYFNSVINWETKNDCKSL